MSNYDMNNNPQARREKRLAAEKRRKKKAALKRARIGQILFFPLMIPCFQVGEGLIPLKAFLVS